MSQNTKYAKWHANSGTTTFTQTDEPVGLPPSSQMPRPGPLRRFWRWVKTRSEEHTSELQSQR